MSGWESAGLVVLGGLLTLAGTVTVEGLRARQDHRARRGERELDAITELQSVLSELLEKAGRGLAVADGERLYLRVVILITRLRDAPLRQEIMRLTNGLKVRFTGRPLLGIRADRVTPDGDIDRVFASVIDSLGERARSV